MQGNDRFRLIVRRGPQPNQSFDLDKDVVTLGRDITNDIVINDPEVSRHHLRLTRGASGYNIEDLGSTNGTFVAGQRLSGVRPLNAGDMIGLGETVTLGYENVREQSDVGAAGPTVGAQPQAYQPPAEQPYTQAEYSPQQPQQDYQYDGPPQQEPAYGVYNAPQAPPSYYDDPYAVREDEPRNAFRWIAIGCLIIAVFCCCSTLIGLVIIDALDLWYDLPIIRNIAPLLEDFASALGFI